MSDKTISKPTHQLTQQDLADIKQAILNAELDTSGELRVHIENVCKGDVMDRAAYVFEKLGIHKTAKRNGVLFYLALKNRKFAVIGDAGINKVVPDTFWNEQKMEMLNYFRENDFVGGLIYGITRTADYLRKHFPYKNGDVNELPDEISFGSDMIAN